LFNINHSYDGPDGGKAWYTGKYDTNGNPIMRRDSSGYYAINENGIQIHAVKPYGATFAVHHVCTNKNCVSTANGGPWAPRFERFFDGANLNINSEINKIAVPGHVGPHPAAYHLYVFEMLDDATNKYATGTPQFTAAVVDTLDILKQQAVTPGHQVNSWLTGGN